MFVILSFSVSSFWDRVLVALASTGETATAEANYFSLWKQQFEISNQNNFFLLQLWKRCPAIDKKETLPFFTTGKEGIAFIIADIMRQNLTAN